MDLSIPGSTTNSPLTPVFGDNVQDLLGTGALNVNPTGIIVVNSLDDAVDNPESGVITLRDAINQANGDTGSDLIVFNRSLFSSQQTITLSGTELDITHNLDIIAPRDPLTGGDLVTVSGNKASRVFEIETGATVSIDGLIVANGLVTNDDGGGIKNFGTLSVSNSTISKNSTPLDIFNISGSKGNGNGAGIYNSGILTVSTSTISNNSGYGLQANYGAGIYNSGILTVSNSTISGNFGGTINGVGYGGGIYNSSSGILTVSASTINSNSIGGGRGGNGSGIDNEGNLVVSNSTISGNFFAREGSGIYNNGNLTLLFSTVTLNYASYGGGVFNSGSANVRNTIIASNQGGFDVSSLSGILGTSNGTSFDTFTSSGYNLIGKSAGSTGFDATGDIVGTSDNPIDPRLAPLDFYGGSTQTFALLPDSPAIGAGDPTVLDTDPTTDQRGLPRRAADGSTDIGAFELS